MRMSKEEITVKFAELTDEANKVNGRLKGRRFYPMSHYHNNKLADFGMYDYYNQRHILGSIHSSSAPAVLGEIADMLQSEVTRKRR